MKSKIIFLFIVLTFISNSFTFSQSQIGTDDDGDGVPNISDSCSNTPAGKFVGADGCEIVLTGKNAPIIKVYDLNGKVDGFNKIHYLPNKNLDILSYFIYPPNINKINGRPEIELRASEWGMEMDSYWDDLRYGPPAPPTYSKYFEINKDLNPEFFINQNFLNSEERAKSSFFNIGKEKYRALIPTGDPVLLNLIPNNRLDNYFNFLNKNNFVRNQDYYFDETNNHLFFPRLSLLKYVNERWQRFNYEITYDNSINQYPIMKFGAENNWCSGDFNGDGNLDFATLSKYEFNSTLNDDNFSNDFRKRYFLGEKYTISPLVIYYGDGNGNFSAKLIDFNDENTQNNSSLTFNGYQELISYDFDGDGKDELFTLFGTQSQMNQSVPNSKFMGALKINNGIGSIVKILDENDYLPQNSMRPIGYRTPTILNVNDKDYFLIMFQNNSGAPEDLSDTTFKSFLQIYEIEGLGLKDVTSDFFQNGENLFKSYFEGRIILKDLDNDGSKDIFLTNGSQGQINNQNHFEFYKRNQTYGDNKSAFFFKNDGEFKFKLEKLHSLDKNFITSISKNDSSNFINGNGIDRFLPIGNYLFPEDLDKDGQMDYLTTYGNNFVTLFTKTEFPDSLEKFNKNKIKIKFIPNKFNAISNRLKYLNFPEFDFKDSIPYTGISDQFEMVLYYPSDLNQNIIGRMEFFNLENQSNILKPTLFFHSDNIENGYVILNFNGLNEKFTNLNNYEFQNGYYTLEIGDGKNQIFISDSLKLSKKNLIPLDFKVLDYTQKDNKILIRNSLTADLNGSTFFELSNGGDALIKYGVEFYKNGNLSNVQYYQKPELYDGVDNEYEIPFLEATFDLIDFDDFEVFVLDNQDSTIKKYAIFEDKDADEIKDLFDSCPSTPTGESVNSVGCSESQIDDDSDGIYNSLDTCPSTPSGESVNSTGCSESQLDDDSDGVKNIVDKCPSTPTGTQVNSDGCELVLAINNEPTGLRLYPNPFKDKLKIIFDESFGERVEVNIFDLNGKRAFSVSNVINGQELKLNKLSSGAYLLKIHSILNEKVSTIKIIKE